MFLRGGGFDYLMDTIEVGNDVFIGAFSTIRYGVKIGNNVVIAAGSVVIKDIPDDCVVGGNPAKVIGNVDDLVKRKLSGQMSYPEYKNGDKTKYYEELWKIRNNENIKGDRPDGQGVIDFK